MVAVIIRYSDRQQSLADNGLVLVSWDMCIR